MDGHVCEGVWSLSLHNRQPGGQNTYSTVDYHTARVSEQMSACGCVCVGGGGGEFIASCILIL